MPIDETAARPSFEAAVQFMTNIKSAELDRSLERQRLLWRCFAAEAAKEKQPL